MNKVLNKNTTFSIYKTTNADNLSNINQSTCNNNVLEINTKINVKNTSSINNASNNSTMFDNNKNFNINKNSNMNAIVSNINNISSADQTANNKLQQHINGNIQTINRRADFLYLKKHGKKIRAALLHVVYAKLQNNNSYKVITNNLENINKEIKENNDALKNNSIKEKHSNQINITYCNSEINQINSDHIVIQNINNKAYIKSRYSYNTMVAYIASKKVVGKAFKRNKVKRRLRSLVREYSSIIPNNSLIIFIASSKTYNIEYSLLKNDFLYCISKINN